jgi:hypothetical protein
MELAVRRAPQGFLMALFSSNTRHKELPMSEFAKTTDNIDARIVRHGAERESIGIEGVYHFKCFDADGRLKWEDTIENTVMTLGKNAILDAALAGSAYTATGPFMGLISSVGYTGVPVAADTMASHSTWFEVDAASHFPTVAARLTTNGVWSAASGGVKALSSTINFTIITNGGTLKGAFLVFGSGAVATLGSTAGTLLSAGLFSGGDKIVAVNDVVQASYSLTLT